MPKATDVHITPIVRVSRLLSRRLLLSASSAAAVDASVPAAKAATGSNPDAELLRLCATFQASHQQLIRIEMATPINSDLGDDGFEEENNRWWVAVRGATDIPANTPQGLRAKAALHEPASRNASGVLTDLGQSLARDILRGIRA
jgi:hypothetical protein